MSSQFSKIVRFDAIRSKSFSTINSSFTALGTPLAHVVTMGKFVNTTDGAIIVSFDGTTENDVLPPGTSQCVYDFNANKGDSSEFVLQKGTQIYVRTDDTITKGSFYFVLIYPKGQ